MSAQLALLWALFIEGLMIFWQLLKIRKAVSRTSGQAEASAEKKEAA